MIAVGEKTSRSFTCVDGGYPSPRIRSYVVCFP